MTTRWDIPNDLWLDETVYILGAGPDMTRELAEQARGHKSIAVNRAIKFFTEASMFVALDPHHPFWEEADNLGFKGMRILGVEHPEYDALYPGMMYETVKISDNHTIQIRNNALAAVRIAYLAGAKKIILLGFDCARYEELHRETGFYGLTQGLKQIIDEIRSNGIEVEQIDSKNQKPGTRPPRRGELVDAATFPKQKKK